MVEPKVLSGQEFHHHSFGESLVWQSCNGASASFLACPVVPLCEWLMAVGCHRLEGDVVLQQVIAQACEMVVSVHLATRVGPLGPLA